MLAYGYGQASAEEATGLAKPFGLPQGAERALRKAPHREPAQPWPPTDPFVYRLYEVVMFYGLAFKNVAHMSVEIREEQGLGGTRRMVPALNGKWLEYKKFQAGGAAGPTSR
jgi:cyanate lyase